MFAGFYGQELTLKDNENGNSQLDYTLFLIAYRNMNLNVGLYRTKPKNAKVKKSHLIQMIFSLICTGFFLCVVGIFSSLKFDPPYVCVYIYVQWQDYEVVLVVKEQAVKNFLRYATNWISCFKARGLFCRTKCSLM